MRWIRDRSAPWWVVGAVLAMVDEAAEVGGGLAVGGVADLV